MERVKIVEREEEIEGRESRLPIGLREPADKVEVNSVQQGLVAAEQHVDQSSNVGDCDFLVAVKQHFIAVHCCKLRV